jgi:hypothetical protein
VRVGGGASVLQLRFARLPRAGRLRIAARRSVPASRGTHRVRVPRLRPGRWRVSAWQGDHRLAVRTVRIRPVTP